MNKKINKSITEWCGQNGRNDILERWDYELNDTLPENTEMCSKSKKWLKCPKGNHDSELYDFDYLYRNPKYKAGCRACNSFAQYMIDKHNEGYLSKIWSKKNIKSPWDYTHGSNQLAWFNCVDNSDHVYQQVIFNRAKDCLCPYCNNRNISTGVANGKSLAEICPESKDVWSDKNKKTPYDYTPQSGLYVWWKCENSKHHDFQRKICNSNIKNFKCPECVRENQKRLKGPDHPNWKGTTPEKVLARMNMDYKEWRKAVYERDKYVCQICRDKKHDRLQAHHIYSFAKYPSIRYDIHNGITLCAQCHDNHYKGSFHQVYGTLYNTPEQLNEYANNKRRELGITEPFNIYDYMKEQPLDLHEEWDDEAKIAS